MNTKPVNVEPVSIRIRMRSGSSQHDRLPPPSGFPPTRRHGILLAIQACIAFFLFWTCCSLAEAADTAEPPSRIEVLRKSLDPFYKQYVVAEGLLIVSSEKVSQPALHEVAYLARKMLANRPDVMEWFKVVWVVKALDRVV
jgi:hypothetical protein